MTVRTFKSRLLSGASSAFVCSMAVAGFMAVQAATTDASASLNGYMAFSTVNVEFEGGNGTLGGAQFLVLDALADNDVGSQVLTSPLNGKPNNFYYNPAHPYSFSAFSHVEITTGMSSGPAAPPADIMFGESYSNVLPTTNAGGFPYIQSFLTFAYSDPLLAAVPTLGKGSSPQARFSYDLSSITWSTSGADNLSFTSTGFIIDSGIPGFASQQAVLTGSFTSACQTNESPPEGEECELANGALVFYTLGDGNVQNIPEPVTMTMFGVGIAGLMVARRRRA